MEKVVYRIARLTVDRGWIPEDQIEWCVYVIYKQTGSMIFFSVTIILSFFLQKLPQTVVFTFCAYILRKRIGGWHASSAFQCQILSVCITIGIVTILGPILEELSQNIIFAAGEAVSVLLLLTRPVYPAQLHFSTDVARINNVKKNLFVIALMILQLVAKITSLTYGTYILLSMITVLFGVVAEFVVQGGEKNEKD